MIKENKVIDFENVVNNNNNYIVNQYHLLSISEGCEFTLILDKQLNINNFFSINSYIYLNNIV